MIFEDKIINVYKSRLFKRYDDTNTAFYFSPDDFPSLIATPYSFRSRKGYTLKGYFYSYANSDPTRVIVFDHGMGAGHRAYMKEIELIASKGYRIFSYDHTGCFESEGEHTGGLSQSCADLDDCLNALKNEADLKDVSFSVIGHSWGAYSTINVSAFHPDLTHVIGIAGPISVMQMLRSNFPGIMKGYTDVLYETEKSSNPKTAPLDARESLKNTSARILLIYSDNDPIVKKKYHYDQLCKALAGYQNVRFVLEKNKSHNPNYTEDAVKYLNEYTLDLTRKLKKGLLCTEKAKKDFIASYDWNRMTAQDENVWNKIFLTLNS